MADERERRSDPSEEAGYGGAAEGVGAGTPEQEQQQPHLEQARRDRDDGEDGPVDENERAVPVDRAS